MNLTGRPIFQKPTLPVRQDIRDSAEGETCTLQLEGVCNHDPRTTVYAHLRIFGFGGMSKKPPEPLGVYSCSNCHDAIDGRSNGPWGYDDLLRGLMRTLVRLAEKKLI